MERERIDLPMGEFVTITVVDGNVKGVYTDLYGDNTKFDIIGDLFLSENSISPEVRHSIIESINNRKMEQLEDDSIKNLINVFYAIRNQGTIIMNGENPLYLQEQLEKVDFETKFVDATNFTQFLITQIIKTIDNNEEEAIAILNGLIQDYAFYIQDVLENGQERHFSEMVQEWISSEE